MKIQLNRAEFWQAAQIGITRHLQNHYKGRKDKYGAERMDGWGINIEGVCAEMAVAKHFNIFYTGNIGDLGACDVNNDNKNLEVRSTPIGGGCLILHPKDDDNSVFILITGKAPNFTIRGWIFGRDGKRKDFWKDPTKGRPAYFIPQNQLNSINTLTIKNK